MFKLNRLGAGALVVALINFAFGDDVLRALGGSEVVASTVNDFVTLAIGIFAIFRQTTHPDA